MDTNIIVAAVWAICAVFSAVIANSKGRSAGGWFILGGIFGVFALFSVGVMPKLEPPERPDEAVADAVNSAAEPQPSQAMIAFKIFCFLVWVLCAWLLSWTRCFLSLYRSSLKVRCNEAHLT